MVDGINDVIIRIPHNHIDKTDGLSDAFRKMRKDMNLTKRIRFPGAETHMYKIAFCLGAHYYSPPYLEDDRKCFLRAIFGNYYEEDRPEIFSASLPSTFR